jgi:hypothetical protein
MIPHDQQSRANQLEKLHCKEEDIVPPAALFSEFVIYSRRNSDWSKKTPEQLKKEDE